MSFLDGCGGTTTVTGTVTANVPPSTDFDAKTLTVTTTPTTLTFAVSPKAILIKALAENPGYVKIQKTGAATFYLMSPGEPITVPISTAVTIDFFRDAGAGTYQITVLAVN